MRDVFSNYSEKLREWAGVRQRVRRHKTYITLIGSNLPPCCFMVEQRRLLKSNTAAAAARKNVASNKQLDGSGISASAHGESGNQR